MAWRVRGAGGAVGRGCVQQARPNRLVLTTAHTGLPPLCAVAEAVIAPAMPSTTARAGGIFMPIINSLSQSAGSKPSEREATPAAPALRVSRGRRACAWASNKPQQPRVRPAVQPTRC